jgi:hypothetical protein
MGEARRRVPKHELQEGEVTYVELAKRPKKHGFKEERKHRSPINWRAGRFRLHGFLLS